MNAWAKEKYLSVKNRLEELGLVCHGQCYFVKTDNNVVWGGVCLDTTSSACHVSFSISASLHHPRSWQLARKFDPKLDFSKWQWVKNQLLSQIPVEGTIKVDRATFLILKNEMTEAESLATIDHLIDQVQKYVMPYVASHSDLKTVSESITKGGALSPLVTKFAFPILFMEAGNVVRARRVLEHFSSRGTYSEAYLANFHRHYEKEFAAHASC